jgi:hypothetical protein
MARMHVSNRGNMGEAMSWFWDFGYLIVAAVVLIGGFLWAGFKTKSSAMLAWGVMFAVIMFTVFATEAVSYWFLPQHATISNGFGVFISAHPVAGVLLLTAWLLFCWALIVHLLTRKKFNDNK